MSRKPPQTDPVTRPCCFADAVARRVAGCTRATRVTRHYRVTIQCTDGVAHGRCLAWLDCVRQASRFTLGVRQSPSALRRPTAAKLQAGALQGLDDLLENHRRLERIDDVSKLLRRALGRYGSLDQVPLAPVIRRVHEFEPDER